MQSGERQSAKLMSQPQWIAEDLNRQGPMQNPWGGRALSKSEEPLPKTALGDVRRPAWKRKTALTLMELRELKLPFVIYGIPTYAAQHILELPVAYIGHIFIYSTLTKPLVAQAAAQGAPLRIRRRLGSNQSFD